MLSQGQGFNPERNSDAVNEQEVNVARENTDWKARPEDTLQTYIVKYPEQAGDLETMFYTLQALKSFVDNDLNHPEEYDKVGKQIFHFFAWNAKYFQRNQI